MLVPGFVFCALLVVVVPALSDGGYFVTESFAGDLAQTRQEVLLAFHTGASDGVERVTYVLRSNYEGDAAEFAWVIPVPSTPEDVVAHESGELLDSLDWVTAPTFFLFSGGGLPPWHGLGCLAPTAMDNSGGGQTDLVQVEASGQAGIFDWFALTSTGSEALLDWLTDNDFVVPEEAEDVLDHYIQQGMHFLALRISEPDEVDGEGEGDLQIPPIQFTCATEQRIYPMVISQVSAAPETEVLVYVLAEHRAEAANVPNGRILQEAVHYDATSANDTNYATVFSETLASFEGMALITEYAGAVPPFEDAWPDMPSDVLSSARYLTRLRTVVTPEQMTVDLEFQDAAEDLSLYSDFWITNPGDSVVAGLSEPLVLLVFVGLFCAARRRAKPIPS